MNSIEKSFDFEALRNFTDFETLKFMGALAM
jgi:hypothetical protein